MPLCYYNWNILLNLLNILHNKITTENHTPEPKDRVQGTGL